MRRRRVGLLVVDVLLIPLRGFKGRVRYRGEAVVFGCVGSIAKRLLPWVCSG